MIRAALLIGLLASPFAGPVYAAEICIENQTGKTLFISSYPVGIGAIDIETGELRYLEGTPCTSEYEDFTPLLWRLGLQSGSITGEPTVRNDR